jgi:Flp pilus assembly protein TadD
MIPEQKTDAPKLRALAPKEHLPNAVTSSKLQLVKSQVAEKVQQAWSLLQKGDAQAAEGLYRQVLQQKPDEPDAALGLAVALHRQKKLDEAWTAYQRSMELWPENPTAHTGMLAILSDTDAQTAVGRLQEWIAARPRDAAAHAALAKLWAKQGKWAEALPLLQRAMSLEPHQGSYVFNLAVAYDQLHRYPEAVSHYHLALQNGAVGLPVAAIQARLVQLQEYQSP